eukprot:PhM_4_TR13675/c0_g1_i4/m.19469
MGCVNSSSAQPSGNDANTSSRSCSANNNDDFECYTHIHSYIVRSSSSSSTAAIGGAPMSPLAPPLPPTLDNINNNGNNSNTEEYQHYDTFYNAEANPSRKASTATTVTASPSASPPHSPTRTLRHANSFYNIHTHHDANLSSAVSSDLQMFQPSSSSSAENRSSSPVVFETLRQLDLAMLTMVESAGTNGLASTRSVNGFVDLASAFGVASGGSVSLREAFGEAHQLNERHGSLFVFGATNQNTDNNIGELTAPPSPTLPNDD